MGQVFLEIPIALAVEDAGYPDKDSRYIYEHLKYFLSRPSPFPLPAIYVSVEEGRWVVTRGHKYLRIARELGRPRIRAILQSPGAESAFPDGVTRVSKEELDREVTMPVVSGYHVYFFNDPLSPQAQQEFLSTFVGFFERLKSPLLTNTEKRVLRWDFPFEARCAEFEALFPMKDQSWFPAYRAITEDFNRRVARIASFQGARFQ